MQWSVLVEIVVDQDLLLLCVQGGQSRFGRIGSVLILPNFLGNAARRYVEVGGGPRPPRGLAQHALVLFGELLCVPIPHGIIFSIEVDRQDAEIIAKGLPSEVLGGGPQRHVRRHTIRRRFR